MDITDEEWAMVRRIVPRVIRSSLHCSIASINPDGSPHVSPIGSFLPTVKGRFVAPPGVRLVGTVGPRRESTDEEIRRFSRIVGVTRRTRGGQRMWKSLPVARDVTIERVVPVRVGAMSRGRSFCARTGSSLPRPPQPR